VAPFVELRGATLIGQGFNMCGEATMSMYMSFWGIEVDSQTQFDIAEAVKPHPDDSNTSPWELVRYGQSLGFESITRVDGDLYVLRRLIAEGIPVMIERGFDELPEDHWMGHYMLIVGYDDASRELAALDSYWGLKTIHPDNEFPVNYWDYDRFDSLWRHFNRAYIVMYPPERTADVQAIIGEEMNDSIMYGNAVQHARDELVEDSNDFWGWINLGASLVGVGDYEHAAAAYDQARSIHWEFRLLWYQFEMYEAYYQTGQYDKVLSWANYPRRRELP
jgi:tetratricopeptide (TPR) repeat protein